MESRIIPDSIKVELAKKLGVERYLRTKKINEKLAEALRKRIVQLRRLPIYTLPVEDQNGFELIKQKMRAWKVVPKLTDASIRQWFGNSPSDEGAPHLVREVIIWIAYKQSWDEYIDGKYDDNHLIRGGKYHYEKWGCTNYTQPNILSAAQLNSLPTTQKLYSSDPRHYFKWSVSPNKKTLENYYFKTHTHLALMQLLAKKQKCLLLADVGTGKSTAIAAIGLEMIEKGWNVRYISLSDELHVSIDMLMQEFLSYQNISNSLYLIDNCHSNPSLAHKITLASSDYPKLKWIFTARPIPENYLYVQTFPISYISSFSDDEIVNVQLTSDDVQGVISKFILAKQNEGRILPIPKIENPASYCGGNLKVMRLYLDTWEREGFCCKLEQVSKEKILIYVYEEYVSSPEKLGAIVDYLIYISILSHYDIPFLSYANALLKNIDILLKEGLVLSQKFYANGINYHAYTLHHATLGKYVLDALHYMGNTGGISIEELQKRMMTQYLTEIIKKDKDGAKYYLNFFHKLVLSSPEGTSEKYLNHDNIFSLFEKEVMGNGKNTIEIIDFFYYSPIEYWKNFCSKFSDEEIVAWVYSYKLSGFHLNRMLSLLNSLFKPRAICEKFDFVRLGRLVNSSNEAIFPTYMVLNDITDEANLSVGYRKYWSEDYIAGLDFYALGKEDSKIISVLPLDHLSLMESFKVATIKRTKLYMDGLGYEHLGKCLRSYIETSGKKNYHNSITKCVCSALSVMSSYDAEKFCNGLTDDMVNSIIQNGEDIEFSKAIQKVFFLRQMRNS